jgi:stage IV sporulation protein FB
MALHVGKVWGIQIALNSYFIALLLLFSLAGMSGKVLLLFSAVLWHEFAHALMAQSLGCRVREIELLPFGGVAKIDRLNDADAGKELMIAATGPLASLLVAGISYFAWQKGGTAAEVLSFYFWVNLTLALFNLLPGLPLDGGRMLRALLSLSIGYSRATEVAAKFSKILCASLVLLIVYEFLNVGTINVTFVVAAVFLYITAQSELMIAGFRAMRLLAFKKADLTERGLLPTRYFIALGHIKVSKVVNAFRPETYHMVIVVDHEMNQRGTLSENEVWQGIQQLGMQVSLERLLKS